MNDTNDTTDTNEVKFNLTENQMYDIQNIANILDMTVEVMAEDALLSYAFAIEERVKRESSHIFDSD